MWVKKSPEARAEKHDKEKFTNYLFGSASSP
jgi:hypothetical protein